MSSSLTKGLRRSTSRSKAKPAAKSAKRAVKAKSPSKPKANRATAAKSSARTTAKTAAKPRPAKKGHFNERDELFYRLLDAFEAAGDVSQDTDDLDASDDPGVDVALDALEAVHIQRRR